MERTITVTAAGLEAAAAVFDKASVWLDEIEERGEITPAEWDLWQALHQFAVADPLQLAHLAETAQRNLQVYLARPE